MRKAVSSSSSSFPLCSLFGFTTRMRFQTQTAQKREEESAAAVSLSLFFSLLYTSSSVGTSIESHPSCFYVYTHSHMQFCSTHTLCIGIFYKAGNISISTGEVCRLMVRINPRSGGGSLSCVRSAFQTKRQTFLSL